jgi:outer membrane protein assembly factor BamB
MQGCGARRARAVWRRCLTGAGIAVVAVSALAGCGGGSGSGPAHDATGSWPAPNGDLANTRNVASAIDAATVARLRVAWRVPIVAEAGYAATPVVAGGVLYTQDLGSNVYAIDLRSGKLRWLKRYDEDDIGPNGVALGDGRVYGTTRTLAFALDAKTGRELWRRPLTSPVEAIDMAPGFADGTVYVSTAAGVAGSIGTLYALDAATGHPRWHWDSIPRSLWGHPEINYGGGLWHPPAVDAQGDLYLAVANPLPFPGTPRYPWGSSRPGPNRWTNSLVKLRARNGAFVWGRQVLPHDIYDWDLQGPAILTRAGGRSLAVVGGKMGFVYAFDAGSGALVWRRAVGRHNGHDRDNLLAMRGGTALRTGVPLLPGWHGGIETQMALGAGTVFVPVNDVSVVWHSQTRVTEAEQVTQGRGELVALDAASGRVRWDRKLPQSPYGAATVTNDVVFTTTFDGTVWAVDARSGRVLWHARLHAATNAPVAVAGSTAITAASLPLAEGQPREIVAYRLGG